MQIPETLKAIDRQKTRTGRAKIQRPILTDFEETNELRPTEAAKLLGLKYPRYNELKNGTHKLKEYHLCSLRAYAYIPKRKIKAILNQ